MGELEVEQHDQVGEAKGCLRTRGRGSKAPSRQSNNHPQYAPSDVRGWWVGKVGEVYRRLERYIEDKVLEKNATKGNVDENK